MKPKKNLIIIISVILIAVFLLTFGKTLAKYATNSIWDYYLKSNGFYFTSDSLALNNQENVNTKWNGGSVSFNLKNSQSETVITEYDINYTIMCEIIGEARDNAICKLNGTNSNEENGVLSAYQSCSNPTSDGEDVTSYNKTECELGGYDWQKQVSIKNMYFDIELTNSSYQLNDVKVLITATSTSPYEKTITGEFNLHKTPIASENEEVNTTYEDFPNYGRLTLTNTTSNVKYLAVTWSDTDLIIGEDKENLESFQVNQNGYINRATIMVPRTNSISLLFYKKNNTNTYTIEDFTITTGVPKYLPSYIAGVYQGDTTNLYVGNLSWQNDALLLNGTNQGIEIYDNNADYSGGITMVIYFNRTIGSGIQNLIMKRSTNMNGYFMFLNNNQLNIDIGGANTRVISTIQIQNGVDYHLVYTWDPIAKGKLYLNGVLYSNHTNGNGTTLNQAGNTPIKVGFDKDGVYGGQKYPFNGEIMAMNIYNSALTSEEILDIYQRDYSLR